MRILAIALSIALPAAAFAQAQPATNGVSLTSKIQAVKDVTDAKGAKKKILVEPTVVIPGQPLVVWLSYKNGGKAPASGFVINNPVPNNMDFTAFGENSGWGVASVDGGKTYGPLATLKVANPDKTMRPAQPRDVTNLRWTFAKPIAPGTGGTISFYGVVE